uniref:Strychnine O-methyltransferase n=1 Tax=Strychnos nux-vomica TaxID=28545 RepID=OMT_STRNX|nr:strychnine O-methyltransferase [Strychnos nux-vomica]
MAMVLENSSAELLRALAHLSNKRGNFKDGAALKCAVELGIPDVIQKHGKPAMTLSELTAALPIKQSKAHCINRIMRVLVNAGFFVEQRSGDGKRDDEEESYALTPACRLLLKDEPLNARAHVLFTLDPAEMVALGSLSEWLQDDYPTAFETANGKNYWDYIAERPARNKLFNEALAVDSRLIATVLISEFKFVFEGLTSLVDVGGGTGTIARAIAETFPNMKCIVLDLQQVVEDADLEGTENLEFVAGDMFEKIPNANAILLKMVLHDWSDEDCVRILKNCKRVIPEKEKGGKIILIELVLGGQNKDHVTVEAEICMDMEMLASFGGKERTEKEWAKLFQDAGLSGYKVFSNLDSRCVIEVYP